MNTWQLQNAKARFSEVVEKARLGQPQIITRHGKEEVVIVSVKDYPLPLLKDVPKRSFVEHLLAFPKLDLPDEEIDELFKRDASLPREFSFED